MPKHKLAPQVGDFLEGPVLSGTSGHDTFVLRAGDGTEVVSGFNITDDRVMLDTKTGVYDGLLGAFQNGPYIADGDQWTSSHGYTFSANVLDYNGDGSLDTVIHMGADSIVLLGVTQVPYSDVFGG